MWIPETLMMKYVLPEKKRNKMDPRVLLFGYLQLLFGTNCIVEWKQVGIALLSLPIHLTVFTFLH